MFVYHQESMDLCCQTVTTVTIGVAMSRFNAEAYDSGTLFFADCGLRGAVMIAMQGMPRVRR